MAVVFQAIGTATGSRYAQNTGHRHGTHTASYNRYTLNTYTEHRPQIRPQATHRQ